MTAGGATRLDGEATWAAMREGVVAFEAPRDVVVVRGPGARDWLQGQLSQDVLALSAGDSADALVLSPEGRIVALVRVTQVTGDELVLDTDAGAGEALAERLRRFRLRVKAEVEQLDWASLALRGPGAGEAAQGARAAGGGALLAAAWRWPGDDGWDLLGPDVETPPGVLLGDAGAAEAARIAAGVPRAGRELGEKTLAHEAGVVERSVSFTKGCYTGQELVARLDARGARVPRRLRGVVIELAAGAALPAAGDELRVDGKAVGAVTSVARSPVTDAAVALAYVRREVDPPAAGETDSGPCRIEALPMLARSPAGAAPPDLDDPAGGGGDAARRSGS